MHIVVSVLLQKCIIRKCNQGLLDSARHIATFRTDDSSASCTIVQAEIIVGAVWLVNKVREACFILGLFSDSRFLLLPSIIAWVSIM